MKCAICKRGETAPGTTTVSLTRDATTLIVKGVPAEVCATCGEAYVDEATTARLLGIAEEVARSGVELDVREYEHPTGA